MESKAVHILPRFLGDVGSVTVELEAVRYAFFVQSAIYEPTHLTLPQRPLPHRLDLFHRDIGIILQVTFRLIPSCSIRFTPLARSYVHFFYPPVPRR